MILEGTRLSSDLAAKLLDTAGAIVLVLAPDGTIVSFNRHMESLCGYPLAEVRGRNWFEVFIPEELHAELNELLSTTAEGTPVIGHQNPIVTKSGERRMIAWHANALQDEHGETLGVISVGMDVTDRHEMQAKLVESERLAAIGMLAAVFAHEVGNPLNAMYLQAQLLRRRIDNPVPGQSLGERVDLIIKEIQRLMALLDEFRAFQRPERILLEPTDIGAVLSDVIETLEPKAAAASVRIHRELVELPRVAGSANKLKQVFINLCKNAIEAMPDGGDLRLLTRREGDRIAVDVQDTGSGIPDELDVFAPFATSKPSGMGLGLPLVREIIERCGGTVRYSSSSAGTTFTVELPIHATS